MLFKKVKNTKKRISEVLDEMYNIDLYLYCNRHFPATNEFDYKKRNWLNLKKNLDL